jgi:predicted enzyme related to lactoylglutathione lyase
MLQDSPMYSYIPARDIRRARAFYEGTLGFRVKQEINGGVVYASAAGTAAFLYPTPNAGTSQASQAFWDVKDIEAEVAELKRRGVVFETYDMPGTDANGITTAGGARAAWFKDSEGNIMAIIQTL